jgi:hypothetical protein
MCVFFCIIFFTFSAWPPFQNFSTPCILNVNNTGAKQLTPKTASVVPPEDGRLTPETCRAVFPNLCETAAW